MQIIKRITPTVFAYQGDVYETDKKTLDRYMRLKTIRNLLSRSRLLSSVEAKQVRPQMVTIIGILCDGRPRMLYTGNVENEILRLKRIHSKVTVCFKTAKVPLAVAQDVIDNDLTIEEITDQIKVVLHDEKGYMQRNV